MLSNILLFRSRHESWNSLILVLFGFSIFWILGDTIQSQIIPNASKILDDTASNKGLADNKDVGEMNFAIIMRGVMSYMSGVLAIAGTILLTWQGALLMASSEDADALAKRQKYIIWIIVAFTLILLSSTIVKKMFLGEENTGFISTNPTGLANTILLEVEGLLAFFTPMLLALAVTMLVIGGFRLIAGSASEEALANARKHIMYSVLGILILVSINAITGIFLKEDKIGVPDSDALITFVANFLKYVSGFLGLVAFIAIVWAGMRLIFSFGDSEGSGEARKIIMYAVAGLILATFAYTIAFFLLPG